MIFRGKHIIMKFSFCSTIRTLWTFVNIIDQLLQFLSYLWYGCNTFNIKRWISFNGKYRTKLYCIGSSRKNCLLQLEVYIRLPLTSYIFGFRVSESAKFWFRLVFSWPSLLRFLAIFPNSAWNFHFSSILPGKQFFRKISSFHQRSLYTVLTRGETRYVKLQQRYFAFTFNEKRLLLLESRHYQTITIIFNELQQVYSKETIFSWRTSSMQNSSESKQEVEAGTCGVLTGELAQEGGSKKKRKKRKRRKNVASTSKM